MIIKKFFKFVIKNNYIFIAIFEKQKLEIF